MEKDVPEIDLSLFKALKILEVAKRNRFLIIQLENYNPSSLVGIDPQSTGLEVIVIRSGKRNMTSFHELLGCPTPVDENSLNSGIWHNLQVLDCSHNQLESLDDCLVEPVFAKSKIQTTLNFLRRLDASHNKITTIQNLQFCYSLEYVDLAFNQITSLKDVAQCLGNVRVLILAYNYLKSISGLEVCYLSFLLLNVTTESFRPREIGSQK
jgi:Leucine-rich repeat (LRR) protein